MGETSLLPRILLFRAVQEDPGDAAFFGGIQPPQALWGKPRPTAPSPPSTKALGASED